MSDEAMYKQYELLVESVVIEDFEEYESKILSQSALSSVQQLRLLSRLRERLRPIKVPEHIKPQQEEEINDHTYFLHQHGKGG